MKKNKIIFIFFLVSLAIFSLSFFRIDPDYLWHIKAGEYMLKNGLLRQDVFSWSVVGEYWMSHEWLFEVIIYGLKKIFGDLHLFIYCFSGSLILLLSIYFGNKKDITKNLMFSVLWFACFLLVAFFMQGRPQVISNILLSISFYFLYDLYKNENSKKIYFLPLISILWANVHGGSSNLPYLLCLIFLIAGSFKFKYTKIEAKRLSKKQVIKYLSVMLLCMIAVCINIHGIKMFIYPYENMLDTTMLTNIAEWRSTTLSELTHYIYFAFLVFILFIFIFSKKRINFVDFVIFAFVAYLGLKSIRFWFYTYIIMSYIVFDYVSKREEDKGSYEGIFILSSMFIVLFILGNHSILKPKYEFLLNKNDIEVIENNKPIRLFNLYNFGGDLVYHNIPVFIDGRADLYGKYNFLDYLNISDTKSNYKDLIESYDFDYLLVLKDYPINEYLENNELYELIYTRDDICYYKKRTTQ